MGIKLRKPGSTELTSDHIGLFEATYIAMVGRMEKTGRLLTENWFRQRAMQKGVGDIQLVNMPSHRKSDSENCLDYSRLDNLTESLVKINTPLLMKTTGNPPGLVAIKRAIRVKFMLENPLARNNISRPEGVSPSHS